MQTITTIGLDIAKSVFQVHGVDVEGNVIIRRQLKRRYVLTFFQKLPPCLVGIEACASSQHWSRELQALGHTVRLMPPAYVKPYVKRQKNDAADAEAICEAVTRANMRFVEVGPVRRVIADRGYDANSFRRALRSVRTVPIIPGRRSRKCPIRHDERRYRDRWRIEAAFCRLKDFRRVATRYDKLALNFLSAVVLAAIIAFWI